MMSTCVVWAFEPVAPGEDVFRNQLQSHTSSSELCCVHDNWITSWIQSTHRVKQLSIHASYSDRFYWEKKSERCSSCLRFSLAKRSDPMHWSYVQPVWHAEGKEFICIVWGRTVQSVWPFVNECVGFAIFWGQPKKFDVRTYFVVPIRRR